MLLYWISSQADIWNRLRVHASCNVPFLSPAVWSEISFLLLRTTALKPFYLFFLESNFVCEIRNTWIINGVFVSNLCLEHWTLFPLKWFLKRVRFFKFQSNETKELKIRWAWTYLGPRTGAAPDFCEKHNFHGFWPINEAKSELKTQKCQNINNFRFQMQWAKKIEIPSTLSWEMGSFI